MLLVVSAPSQMNVLNNEHLLNLCVFSGAGISYDVTARRLSFKLLIIKNKLKLFNIL